MEDTVEKLKEMCKLMQMYSPFGIGSYFYYDEEGEKLLDDIVTEISTQEDVDLLFADNNTNDSKEEILSKINNKTENEQTCNENLISW